MRRREFITLLGGATAAWPLAVRAQQGERVRRVGVLMNTTADDVVNQANVAAFRQVMVQSGWTDGRNVKIDVRWSGGDVARLRKDAEELLGLRPDVIVAGFGPTTGVLQQLTRTVPIVFTTVVDPVGAGFVDSLARPGGNATGFIQAEYTLSGKWLELLREIAPQVSRVGVVRTAGGIVGIGQCFRFRWKSGLAADIAAVTELGPRAVFGSIHRTCLSALVADRAMDAWYHPSIA
jgi:putative ABC transport system substrate-binding protein